MWLKGFSTHRATRGDQSLSELLIPIPFAKIPGSRCFQNSDAEANFSFLKLNACSDFPSDQRGNMAQGNRYRREREEWQVWSLCLKLTLTY